MGKFVNSSYVDEVNYLQDNFKENILDNPFYKFNATKENIVTYYSLDMQRSTVDEGSGNIETFISMKDSPLKYRKIENFVIYGAEKIALNLDMSEYGLESSEISGEAMIIAGTVIPCSSDYFIINHTDTEIMFRVISVQPDTLPNGANCFKIEYKLMHTDKQYIDENLSGDFKFLHNNVGTNLNPIIEFNDYDKLELYDKTMCSLIRFYKDMYYDSRVESFILKRRNQRFYDSYLTQFIKDSNILNVDDDYMYITQQVKLDRSFNIKYNRSFFNALVEKNKTRVDKVDSFCYGIIIDSKVSIFYNRFEDYYNMNYERIDMNPTFLHDIVLEPFDREFINKIVDNSLYEEDNKVLHNIIIKYFNDTKLDEKDIESLEYIDIIDGDTTLFYFIPCIIYILEREIRDILDIKKSVFLR